MTIESIDICVLLFVWQTSIESSKGCAFVSLWQNYPFFILASPQTYIESIDISALVFCDISMVFLYDSHIELVGMVPIFYTTSGLDEDWADGLKSLDEIQVNYHQDFMASTSSDFFRGQMDRGLFYWSNQGILKGEVSLYCWPPVWLVWNQLYDNWQFLFLFTKQAFTNRSNRRSTVQWYFPL